MKIKLINVAVLFFVVAQVWGAPSSSAASAPADGKNCWARKSGNWNDPIWSYELKPDKNIRPREQDNAALGATGGTLEINTPVKVFSLSQRAEKGKTKISTGADIDTHWFFGERGGTPQKGSCGIFEMTGGALTVRERFVLAGQLFEDSGTGTFSQRGGVVNIGGTGIYLTGNYPLTSSKIANGVYELQNGVLNIQCTTAGDAGIIKGVGNGIFKWDGGTLNTSHAGISIENAGTGNLSPGGDEAVGSMRLTSKTPQTYTQGPRAKMTVNVASKNKYDQVFWLDGGKKAASKVVIEPGTLFEIVPLDGYSPKPGDTYNVFIADAIELKGPPVIRDGKSGKYKAQVTGNTPQRFQILVQ